MEIAIIFVVVVVVVVGVVVGGCDLGSSMTYDHPTRRGWILFLLGWHGELDGSIKKGL